MKKTLLVLSVITASLAHAQPGSLDLSFGTGGSTTTAVSTAEDYANSIAIQPDGKILAGGFAKMGTKNEFALCRYNADGTLDNTFSADGIVTTALGTVTDGSAGMALQPDGKIVLAGYSMVGAVLNIAVVRYNADGTLDNTFSGDGMVTAAIGSSHAVGMCVALQADGKIVVAGKANNGTNNDFVVVRLNADGTPDVGFGMAGKAVTAFPGGAAEAKAIALQADGRIVVVGLGTGTTSSPYAAARYNTDGTLDNTFSGDGLLEGHFMAGGSSVANAVIVLADGKILVGGEGRLGATGSNRDFSIARLNADGSADATFGTGGVVVTGIGTDHDNLNALAVQADGKIVSAGYAYPGTTMLEFALIRYNADGSLDPTFGTAGKVVTEMGTGANQITALALQPDGKIVGAGSVNAGPTADFVVARYQATGTSGIAVAPGSSQKLSAYPNPASGFVSIDYTLATASHVSLYITGIDGRVVATAIEHKAQDSGKQHATISIPSHLPAGNYFAVLVTAYGIESIKIAIGR